MIAPIVIIIGRPNAFLAHLVQSVLAVAAIIFDEIIEDANIIFLM